MKTGETRGGERGGEPEIIGVEEVVCVKEVGSESAAVGERRRESVMEGDVRLLKLYIHVIYFNII